MKTFLLLFVLTSWGIQAQTIHELDWDTSVGTSLNLTLKVGESVRWTWTDNLPHSVVSESGSTQAFASPTLTGNGNTYLFTFTQVGTNPYICGVHTQTMGGIITVEEALSDKEFSLKNIALSPNPAKDFLTLNIPNGLDLKTVTIYNILGKEINSIPYLGNKINISNLTSGMYLLKLNTSNSSISKRFFKH
ncbi:T9SS type A sorting domain-containing protein [Aestuariibaculum sp. YM273]|uniref:T9SS type A sorting domain-containing protein n=1 Tax=Aestuariibaculum sp. YM273 TaxID=3070659 RepID=UPI0027DD6893|nr:T9SS type A sorting domain-containing protein [Aestuariibaculum sp. YM273]WMI64550.1 T9SS type A sorting domain-containing protein [Aestuariibaculum sp. YM273]